MPKEVTITIAIPSDAELSSKDAAPGSEAGTPPSPLSLAELGSPANPAASLDETPSPMALDQLKPPSAQGEDLPEAHTVDLPTGPVPAQQEATGAPTEGSDSASAADAEPDRPPLPPDPPRRTKD